MNAAIRSTCLGILSIAFAVPAAAQSVRSTIANARLGPGYAQLLNLAATPDISEAHYELTGGDTRPTIDVLRVPFESRWRALSGDSDLYWRIAAGYLEVKDDFPVDAPPGDAGGISSKWSAYSLSGGLVAKIRLAGGFTLEPALDLSAAELDNRTRYSGAATSLQPLLDRILFNWRTNASLVTPNLGLEWKLATPARTVKVRGHLAWSWISSFDESDPVLKFHETAGVYSIRAEHVAPTGMQLAERALHWVVFGGYAGFFGDNRKALGFNSIAQAGAGVEAPLSITRLDSTRVRLGASYLFGSDVKGWTVSLGFEY
ncbi:autotransporter outer membrane beta-barrel domain-containing protein [Ramlibacter tataouinensis]|uniref:Uncharacterized protein n=1 Tax=Ramlibacter tataouinensis TaxID=94132 RepID=A0A127JUN2_9BURK|nr:autotransporter outer membrane beta-barrel domain-containing protein [Ramlibacter tataouinensis]AMO23717.1 hypothetical protein UC35_13635 [Ramlibacter tataouinensis]